MDFNELVAIVNSIIDRPDSIPMSIDLIEPNLYLGSRPDLKDLDTLKKHNITHILTIDAKPLEEEIRKGHNITTKLILVKDEPTSDLLGYFDEAHDFISEGLSKGAVLVHCILGVSRSSTIMIAFIMKKYHLTFREAFERVKQKRKCIKPNEGFISQLQLYENMKYTVDSSSLEYKKYKLQNVASVVCKLHAMLQDGTKIIQDDPELKSSPAESKFYCCKKCNKILAGASDLIPHANNGDICTKSHFVMPVAWMDPFKTVESVLCCPQCKAVVGASDWNEGIRCSCDFRQVPAFCLTPSAVNFITY